MVLVALLLTFLSGCALTDLLDGRIDDPRHCCLHGTDDGVRTCVARFTEPGHCKVATCPGGDTAICRELDGGLVDAPDDLH